MFEKIKEVIRHNLGLTWGGVLAILLAIMLIGCEMEVMSPISNTMVTEKQLAIEVSGVNSEVELAKEKLVKLGMARDKIANVAIILAEGGTLNPLLFVTSLLSLIGIGAVADNRTKDKIIKTQANLFKGVSSGGDTE